MKSELRLVLLGDVHFGAGGLPAEHLGRVFEEIVFPWLEANEFDALIQLGDWFDKRLGLDSEDAKAAMRTMVRLCQLCNLRGVPFRVLRGTLSHDGFQLQNYSPLETEYPGFRIIADTCHEELLKDYDVLWMPEVYPTDYSDHYGRFLFDEEGSGLIYDAIFGHGEIDVAAGWSAGTESERHYGGTPCHSAEMLMEHSSGPVWFGHIHKRFRHSRVLGYPGSLSRWVHGEEAPKGFDVLDLKRKEGGGWSVVATEIENSLAPMYRTVLASEILSAADALDTIVARIRAAAGDVHRLRVKMADFQLGVEELSLVRGAFVSDPRVDIVSAARVVNETTQAVEEAPAGDPPVRGQLSYLRDQAIPGEERLLRYLHEKNPDRSDVTIEEVRELTAPPAERAR
jgi:DNA repair exonuclease SbcCD nuclease subunit